MDAGSRAERIEAALEALIAVQNGPPLVRDEAEWQAAMDEAHAALAAPLPAPGGAEAGAPVRQEFETWARLSADWSLSRDSRGEYEDPRTYGAWYAWEDRVPHPTTPAPLAAPERAVVSPTTRIVLDAMCDGYAQTNAVMKHAALEIRSVLEAHRPVPPAAPDAAKARPT